MSRGTVTELLADRVRKLRAELGWSAQRLADECARAGFGSLTRGMIAKIESGARRSVTAEQRVIEAERVALLELRDLEQWLVEINQPDVRTLVRRAAGITLPPALCT